MVCPETGGRRRGGKGGRWRARGRRRGGKGAGRGKTSGREKASGEGKTMSGGQKRCPQGRTGCFLGKSAVPGQNGGWAGRKGRIATAGGRPRQQTVPEKGGRRSMGDARASGRPRPGVLRPGRKKKNPASAGSERARRFPMEGVTGAFSCGRRKAGRVPRGTWPRCGARFSRRDRR